jgi:hypothetical protein
MKPQDVYTDDPNYPDQFVEDTRDQENDTNIPGEVRNYLDNNPTKAEEQDYMFPVYDEESSRAYEDFNEKRLKYFRAKRDY